MRRLRGAARRVPNADATKRAQAARKWSLMMKRKSKRTEQKENPDGEV